MANPPTHATHSRSSSQGSQHSTLVSDDDYADIPNVQSPLAKDESPRSSTFAESKHNQETDPCGHVHPYDETIPHEHSHRTVVLCFDGTGDQFDADNSNIVQFFSMLKKDDKSEQLVYYQAGIGTYTIPQIATPWMANFSKTLDMMVGIHLNAHVMAGYEFLMQNHEAGDKICIFGFSRGAYTARALAGMLHEVGLLPVSNHQQLPFAYHMYCQDNDAGWNQSRAFKKAFSINVDVEFLGVWDTVSSVGMFPRKLPFTRASDNIRYFRQALALDEHRFRFRPSTWRWPHPDHEKGVKREHMARSVKKGTASSHHESKATNNRMTDVDEVWFAGCHCDIGGGAVPNGTRHSLARIPLRWMIRQCFIANTGILFHRETFKKIGMDPDTLYPDVQSRPPPIFQDPCISESILNTVAESSSSSTNDANIRRSSQLTTIPDPPVISHDDDPTLIVYTDGGKFQSEELEDLSDALCPIYDQLDLAKAWWVLELIPQKLHSHDEGDCSWHEHWTINMGCGREICQQAQGMKVHRTVKIRMEAEGLCGGKYWPKAKLADEPQWID
ncbi:hypothetical protein BJ138DRAFT_1017569 [Hygrophoropsis aurantiaca]|uniref:Uncharacterized protein n=1 Tax=Hygrophoropsis aurantiaca TaxID=72124 RepID=A0ACB7ZWD5_9AGAM|nr:hypothetical protein BJ138DRAFT_1017569 [Hygrophoropsis aurantiaca]